MLSLRPISYADAAAYVDENHRHHRRPVGHKYSIACYDGDRLCGVAMVGRPVSRYLDDGLTLEVNRLCTDGTRNACSMLYCAAWRAARAMGYQCIVTYTLASEPGTSLRAAGWICDGEAGGTHWTGARNRGQQIPAEKKMRWHKGGTPQCKQSSATKGAKHAKTACGTGPA